MKAILAGPPHSGKSCLREALREAIKRIPGTPYPYVITACPDGEGAWYQETVRRSEKEADSLKVAHKSKWNEYFVQRVADDVRNCTEPLTLIDIGGIPDERNSIICAVATHAVLLFCKDDQITEWRNFCDVLGVKIIVEIHSDYGGKTDLDLIHGKDGVWRGSVHHLERGEDASDRPSVKKLAEILSGLAANEMKKQRSGGAIVGTFNISLEDGNILHIGFGSVAQNDQIVRDAVERLGELIKNKELTGGRMIRINGPASLPVAVAIAHSVNHLYEYVAVFDPKLSKYIVVVSHGKDHRPGDIVE